MKSGVDIILSKLTKLELPDAIIFKIENHVYHWIHSLRQPLFQKDIIYKRYKEDTWIIPRWGRHLEYPRKIPLSPHINACEEGYLNDLKVFIAAHKIENPGISVEKMLDTYGYDSMGCLTNALLIAAENERDDIIEHLLQYNIDINVTDVDKRNALHLCHPIFNPKGDVIRCVELLLKNMPLNTINYNHNGETPLDYIYESSEPIKWEVAKLIRQYGGKANYHDEKGNDVGMGYGDLNDISTESFHDLNEKYKKEFPAETPMHSACIHNRVSDLKLFVVHHGSGIVEMLNKQDEHGRTLLMYAAWEESFEVLLYLLNCGVNTAITDNNGNNVLHYSAGNEEREEGLTTLLTIMSMESINHKNNDGWTPFDLVYLTNKNDDLNEFFTQEMEKKGAQQSTEDYNEWDYNYIL